VRVYARQPSSMSKSFAIKKKCCTGDIHVTEIRTRCWGRAGALLPSALSLGRIALSVPRGLVSAAELLGHAVEEEDEEEELVSIRLGLV
jgi:hypothetical protein